MRACVLVTRPGGKNDPLVPALAAAGFEVAAVPTVAIEAVGAGSELDAAVARLDTYHTVVVTSARAVAALRASATRTRLPLSWPGGPDWVAVGRATATALRHLGIEALVPEDERGLGILDLPGREMVLDGRRVLLPRADRADPRLPEALRARGARVYEVVAYRTVLGPATSAPGVAAALDNPKLAAVVVASPSAVRGLVALASQGTGDGRSDRLGSIPFVSIGPTTSAAVRRAGLRLGGQASAPSVDGLVDAVTALVDGRSVSTRSLVLNDGDRSAVAGPLARRDGRSSSDVAAAAPAPSVATEDRRS